MDTNYAIVLSKTKMSQKYIALTTLSLIYSQWKNAGSSAFSLVENSTRFFLSALTNFTLLGTWNGQSWVG